MTNDTPRFIALIDYMRAKLCAEYEASADLKAEFTTGEDYAAYTLNTATAKPLVRKWRDDFDAEAAEKAIAAAEVKSNVRKADARRAAGRLRVAR